MTVPGPLAASRAAIPECEDPVFIVGAARSGTTWLQSLVTLHPRFYSRPETKLFQVLLRPPGPLSFDEQYPQHTHPIPDRVSPQILEAALERLDALALVRLGEEARNELRVAATNGSLTPAKLLDSVMALSEGSRPPAARCWVEKSPRHILHVADIFHAFPRARIVCIRRDLIDQAVSADRTFGFPVLTAIRDAEICYRAYERALADLPDKRAQCVEVQYEDLKRDPASHLATIHRFLGVAPLDLTAEELRSRSRDVFQDTYAKTSMMGFQPGMTDKADRDDAARRALHAYMLARISNRAPPELVRARTVPRYEWIAPRFVGFVLRQAARESLIAAKRMRGRPRGRAA